MDYKALLVGYALGYLACKVYDNKYKKPSIQQPYRKQIGSSTEAQQMYLSHGHLQEICTYGRAGCDSI